ncbi:MAG: spore germination protein [Clostridium sp.]|nr:spore germination protein [Clostridium sp.]
MFSENGRISEKQMRRMLVLPLYASLVFVVPHLSAWLFGESIVPGLIVFLVFACIYVGCIYGLSAWVWKTGRIYGVSICDWERQAQAAENKKADIPLNGKKSVGAVGRLLVLLQALRLIVRLAFYICLSIEVLGEGQVPYMPNHDNGNVGSLLVVLPLLLTALYAAGKYMEKQGRIYELIFWILYIPLVLVLIFGIWEVDFSVFLPKWNLSVGALLFRGYLLLSFLLPVENYILLRPFLQEQSEKKNGKKYPGMPSFFAVMGTVLLVCVLTLFILGIYGVHGAGSEDMLTVAIMRYIRLPLGFIERVDVLLIWFFMIGCFVLIGQTLYFSGRLLSAAFPKVKRDLLLLAVLAAAMAIVAFMPGYDSTLWLYRSYGAVMDLPLSLLLPLIGVLDIQSFHGREKWNVEKGGNDNAVS